MYPYPYPPTPTPTATATPNARETLRSQARRLLRERRVGGFTDVSQEEELAIRIKTRSVEAEGAQRSRAR